MQSKTGWISWENTILEIMIAIVIDTLLIERQHPFGVLYLDLDKFKEVNDRYRHDIGDKLLIEVSSRIRSCLRKEDLLFRIGET